MIIEASITIDDGSNVDINMLTQQLETILGNINGEDTSFNVVEMDDPISTNPLNFRVGA